MAEEESSTEHDSTLKFLKENDLPLTKANYLAVAWLGNPPKELDAEADAELPQNSATKTNRRAHPRIAMSDGGTLRDLRYARARDDHDLSGMTDVERTRPSIDRALGDRVVPALRTGGRTILWKATFRPPSNDLSGLFLLLNGLRCSKSAHVT